MKDILKTPGRLGATLAIVLMLAACNDEKPTQSGDMVPDFKLTDVNPNSATYNQKVSPRDYVGRISAWYFGAAG